VFGNIAQNWIQIGQEQYERVLYKAAEQSLVRAQDYQEYLTAAELEELNELLKKVRVARFERKRILEHIRTAGTLVEQQQLIKGKAHLEKAKDSEFLTEDEQGQITEELRKIDEQLAEQQMETAELYKRSVEFYNSGQLKEACKGFIKVANNGLFVAPAGKRAEDYLMKIDNALASRVESLASTATKPVEKSYETAAPVVEDRLIDIAAPVVEPAEPQVSLIRPKINETEAVDVPEAAADESKGSEVVDRRTSIIRGYVKAVVNDTVTKVQDYIGVGEFDKAEETVATAESVVNKYRQRLGDALFVQYSSKLKQLSEQIDRGRIRWLGDWENKSAWRL